MAGRGSDQQVVEEVIRQGGEHRNISSGIGLGIRFLGAIVFAGVADGANAGVSVCSREGLLLAASPTSAAT